MPVSASPATAVASASAKTLATVADVSVAHVFTQMILVVVVLGGGIWMFGKVVSRRRGRASRTDASGTIRQLRVVSRAPIGKDQHLAVVHWGDREILIGISGSSVTLLSDLDRDSSAGPSPISGDQSANAGPFPATNSISGLFNTPRAMTGLAGARPQSLLEALRALTARS